MARAFVIAWEFVLRQGQEEKFLERLYPWFDEIEQSTSPDNIDDKVDANMSLTLRENT